MSKIIPWTCSDQTNVHDYTVATYQRGYRGEEEYRVAIKRKGTLLWEQTYLPGTEAEQSLDAAYTTAEKVYEAVIATLEAIADIP
jgi:hypothetical protein